MLNGDRQFGSPCSSQKRCNFMQMLTQLVTAMSLAGFLFQIVQEDADQAVVSLPALHSDCTFLHIQDTLHIRQTLFATQHD